MTSNSSDEGHVWDMQICGPQETACMLLTNNSTDDFIKIASCYDLSYNNGRSVKTMKPNLLFLFHSYNVAGKNGEYKCYDSGQHCWDNECHEGTICLCENVQPGESCNMPDKPTPSPQPTTPGSGLSCWYGSGIEINGTLDFNLTKQACDVHEVRQSLLDN